MKMLRLLVLLALTAEAVAGCGQKGPLVLPDAQHPRKKVKFPAAPKTAAPAASTETAPSAPAGPAPASPAPAGQAPAPATPEATPGPNAAPDPAPP
jgi:predicted small lipoprotein YifL